MDQDEAGREGGVNRTGKYRHRPSGWHVRFVGGTAISRTAIGKGHNHLMPGWGIGSLACLLSRSQSVRVRPRQLVSVKGSVVRETYMPCSPVVRDARSFPIAHPIWGGSVGAFQSVMGCTAPIAGVRPGSIPGERLSEIFSLHLFCSDRVQETSGFPERFSPLPSKDLGKIFQRNLFDPERNVPVGRTGDAHTIPAMEDSTSVRGR